MTNESKAMVDSKLENTLNMPPSAVGSVSVSQKTLWDESKILKITKFRVGARGKPVTVNFYLKKEK